jgi:hypothetical protein
LLPNFLSQTDLTSLIPNSFDHPPTHARGSRCIDYIFGSTSLVPYVTASGITAFYDRPYIHSDHRGLFIDIHELSLFGANLNTIIPPLPRRIVSTSKVLVQKFLDSLDKTQQIPTLLNRILELQANQEWTPEQHDQLESIDVAFTNLLLEAENQSAVPVGHSWSPTIDKHSLIYNYWSIKLHGRRNNININNKLREIEQQLPEHSVQQQLKTTNPVKQMRHARRNLINSRLQSEELRDTHHTILHDKLISEGKLSKARAVLQQRNKERRRRCWRTFKTLKTGGRTAGGITHVLQRSITNPTIIDRIQAQHQLDPTLLDRNIPLRTSTRYTVHNRISHRTNW